MKRVFIIFGILFIFSFWAAPVKADRNGFFNTVVIDPGHGGRDPGAVGRKSQEKDITLAISLKLGQYIKEHFPQVNVIYTRETDILVELDRRAAIANENHADLFISIHCNSASNTSAYGTETFVMGLHRSQANLEVARKENAAILYEDDYLETYDGFDPHSPEANIIFTLYQNAFIEQSLQAAALVQEQFRDRARRHDRGVKQAGFLVLYEITMPGILIETGFLSNPREEAYLMSQEGQTHLASAIFRAFREYKQQHDEMAEARKNTLIANSENQPDEIIYTQVSHHQETQENISDNNTQDVIFKVQFATSVKQRPLNEFSPLENVDYYFHDGLYKYIVGQAKSLDEAAELQLRVQQAGFKDAFVVAFLGEERISAAHAIRLLNQQENNH